MTGSVALVWPVMTAAFLASLVEAVEALTIALAVATAGVRERLLQWVSFSTELGRPRHVRFPTDPSWPIPAADRVNVRESLFAEAFNGLLQQNLPIGDIWAG